MNILACVLMPKNFLRIIFHVNYPFQALLDSWKIFSQLMINGVRNDGMTADMYVHV